MKYEVTQQQYVDFLNSLTFTQQSLFTTASPDFAAGTPINAALSGAATGQSRNGIKIMSSGVASSIPAQYGCDLGGATYASGKDGVYNGTNDGQNIACNYISISDLEAYLDWAALRPMTVLEYEKICRGASNVNNMVPDEYAWGTAGSVPAYSKSSGTTSLGQNGSNEIGSAAPATSIQALGSSTNGLAAIAPGAGGTGYTGCTVQNVTNPSNGYGGCGPLRVGFAATNVTVDRVSAGASYYGVLDMTGNVVERCVSAGMNGTTVGGSTGGLSYQGTLGDGDVSSQPNDWPGGNTLAMIWKGGSWYSTNTNLLYSISSLAFCGNLSGFASNWPFRTGDAGGRGVR
jgi:formylglycine-generating enzyme required for sulfatase activity